MATSTLTYEKLKGAADTKGLMFETKMAALLFLRGINSGNDFQLASNAKDAGAFDDAVFRYKSADQQTWSTVLVQLKHTKEITTAMLKDKKNKNFYLSKYLTSYENIKKHMSGSEQNVLFKDSNNDCILVLFTNAKGKNNANASENLGGRDKPEGVSEKFLWSGTGTIVSFDPASDSAPDKHVVGCLGQIGDSQKEFFLKFRLFIDQPSHEAMDELIKSELRKSEIISNLTVDIDMLYKFFIANMLTWHEECNYVLDNKSQILDQAYGKTKIAMEDLRARDNLLDISFEDEARNPFQELLAKHSPILLIESSESSTRISCSKLLQVITDSLLFLSIEMLLENKNAVISVCQDDKKVWLVLSSKKCKKGNESKYLEALKEIQQSVTNIRIAVVLSDIPFCDTLRSGFENCLVHEDPFEFSQLDKKSQDSILNEQIIFQGYEITLNKIIDRAASKMNASSVIEILTNSDKPLTVGPILPDEIDYYVDRRLDRAFVKDSLFSETQLTELGISITIQYTTENDIQFALSKSDPTLDPQVVKEAFESFPQADSAVFDGSLGVGPRWQFEMFDCNFLFLRNNDDVYVTAIRFCRHSEQPRSSNAWLLFVPKDLDKVKLNTLEEYHKSQHLLCCEDGNISWIHSSGDIKIIRRHLDQDPTLPRQALNFDFKDERVVLICAEPGMGKTTLAKRVARHTKENFKDLWVLFIALNDHDNLYSEEKQKNALEFLTQAKNIKSDVEKALLKVALEEIGNVVLIIDGCDEISPKYAKQCLELLLNIFETKAKRIMITSRNSKKSELENYTFTLSINVNTFSEADKKEFLQKFWKLKPTLPEGQQSESQVDDFISLVLQKMSQTISNKEKDFLSIPLQMHIMATVLNPHGKGTAGINLPDKMDLLYLMEKFVKLKFRVYLEEKMNITKISSYYKDHFKAHKEQCDVNHGRAALLLIVGEIDLQELLTGEEINEAKSFLEGIESCNDSTGIIDSIFDGKPRFIHRVFAEYFVAVWFSKHFKRIPKHFLAKRLYNSEYSVVRIIFDRILARGHDLHTAVLNKDLESVRALIQSGENVNARDKGGRTALHLASAYTPKRDEKAMVQRNAVLDLLIEHTTDFEQLDCLHEEPPIKYADLSQSWTAIDKLIKRTNNAEKYLKITTANKDNSEIHEYAIIHSLENLVEFGHSIGLNVDQTYLSARYSSIPNVVKKLSIGVIKAAIAIYPSKDDPLHYASANGDLDTVERTIQSQIESGKTGLSLKEYINKKDGNGSAALHFAAYNGHVKVVTCLMNHGADPEIREDKNGSTPLQAAVITNCVDVVRTMLNALPESERLDHISLPNAKWKYNAFHLAIELERRDIISYLLETANEVGGDAARAELVRSKNGRNSSAIQMVAEFAEPKIMKVLLSIFGKEQVVEFINNERDWFGDTLMHIAAKSGSLEIVELLSNLGARLDATNNKGLTALEVATEKGHQKVIEFLSQKLNTDFDMD